MPRGQYAELAAEYIKDGDIVLETIYRGSNPHEFVVSQEVMRRLSAAKYLAGAYLKETSTETILAVFDRISNELD